VRRVSAPSPAADVDHVSAGDVAVDVQADVAEHGAASSARRHDDAASGAQRRAATSRHVTASARQTRPAAALPSRQHPTTGRIDHTRLVAFISQISTVKNIRLSTDILWRVFFHILTEPVPYTVVSVN